MKKITQTLLLLLVVVASFTSCSKKSDPAVAPAVAIIGKWKLSTVKETFGPLTLDITSDFSCLTDDTSEFKTGGICIITGGSKKCDSSEPATETVSYILSADAKSITVDGSNYIVVELNTSILKYKTKDPEDYTTLTYTKI